MDTIAALATNPTLRNFAQDYSQKNVSKIAEFLAPTVEVPTLIGQYKLWDAKHRYKRPNTKRNLVNGRASRIGFTADDETYRIEPHALDFPLSDYESLEGEELRNMLEYGGQLLIDAAELDHEAETIQTALTKVGAGTTQNFKAAGFDVIQFYDEQIKAVMKVAKNGANVRAVMGLDSWLRTKNHSSVKAAYNGTKGSYKIPSLQAFIEMLAFPIEIMVSNMVEDTGPEGGAESVDFMLTNQLIFFPCSATPNTMDASWLKTFRLRNRWMVPGSYESEDKRDEILKLDWNKQLKETNAGSATRFNVTYA